MKRVLRRAWSGWLRFATVLGNVQMVILLTLVYWLLLAPIALPYRFFGDPLRLRRAGAATWVERTPTADGLTAMRRQG